MNPILRDILQISLFNLGLICMAIGLLLLLAPQRFLLVAGRLNRWISTEETFQSMDRPRAMDGALYRRHRIVGCLMLLGSTYIIYMFWVRLELSQVLPSLPVLFNAAASAWIYESLLFLMRSVGIIGLAAGAVIAVRPSLLKHIEAWGNRWIAIDRFIEPLDRQKDIPVQWFPGHPRLFGLAIVLGSGYILWQCGRGLWGGA